MEKLHRKSSKSSRGESMAEISESGDTVMYTIRFILKHASWVRVILRVLCGGRIYRIPYSKGNKNV